MKAPPKKISKMVPRSVSEEFWGASRLWGSPKVPTPGAQHTLFGTTWAILGAVLGTAGRSGGFPKSKVLGAGRAKISKHDIQNEASEKV